METIIVYRSYIGIMEKKMEATMVYWSYIEILTFQIPQPYKESRTIMLVIKLANLCRKPVMLPASFQVVLH